MDSSTYLASLVSPALKGDLNSIQTDHLLSNNHSYNEFPMDESVQSPLFSLNKDKHLKLQSKIMKLPNIKKHKKPYKTQKKHDKKCLSKKQNTIPSQKV